MPHAQQAIALIIATGDQDLKLWERVPGDKPQRNDADLISGRPLREALLASGAWRILLPKELRAEPAVQCIDMKSPPAELPPGMNAGLFEALRKVKRRGAVLVDSQGKLLLRPAKVENLVERLTEYRDKGQLRVERALIFTTDRLTPEQYCQRCPGDPHAQQQHRQRYEKEPINNGRMLGAWLAERFELPMHGEDLLGAPGVGWSNLLRELPSYEGPPNTPDHPLYRALARTADQAIHRLADGFDHGHALVCATGGSCDAKACILASAELRFPGRSYDYPETEGGGCFEPAQLTEATGYVVPTRSLTARGHCADRIRRGDLAAAWGTVAHLDQPGIGAHEPWLAVIRELDLFIHEAAPGEHLLPDHQTLTARPGVSRLLLQAFLVEAALQGEQNDWRITEALTGLTGWVENALFQLLVKFIPVCLPGYTLDPASAELRHNGSAIDRDSAKTLIASLRQTLTQAQINSSPPGRLLGDAQNKSSVKIFGANAKWWRHWLCAQSDSAANAAGLAVERMEQYLTSAPGGGKNLRSYRNQASHGSLGADARAAIQELAAREAVTMGSPFKGNTASGPLWRLGPDSETCSVRFLDSPLVLDISTALDINNPHQIYQALITNLLQALHADILVPDTPPPCP